MQSVNDIRSGFLEFFRRHGHEVRPSGSLVPHNDPTLMFTNAGMNQFKNVFTGAEKLPFVRATTSQKCVRAGGKHNDLDNVGYTARHHTFFEMLGNFSFGDYFKEGAIAYAWEFLTKDLALPKEKLYVTVYPTDNEAAAHWKKIAGFGDDRIIRLEENLWSMGDTGPCGYCSEIFYDHGPTVRGGLPGTPEENGDRYVEIWNLVFMQFDKHKDGSQTNLPKPCIDTGMGLERMAAVMQGVHDNYDIDLFRHLIAAIKDIAGAGGEPAAYKVIADHLRSSCFLMADGVLPSNEGRGYVLRRIMRRAMRYAHQMGCKDPLMYRLVPSLVTEMGGAYPELKRAEATITDNLRQEEERFKQTLERGLKLLEEEVEKLPSPYPSLVKKRHPDVVFSTNEPASGRGKPQALPAAGEGKSILPGEVAFKLYDTYGFPLDLTQDILRGRGIDVDADGFEKSMEGQRDMARSSHKGSGDTATGKIWFELKEKLGPTEFLGYDVDEADGKVLAIVKDGAAVQNAGAGDEVFIVLDKTPFYGESGGQVGDTGRFLSGGKDVATINDTKKPLEDFIVHSARPSASLSIGDNVHAVIDTNLRNDTRANHSATHLLHKALRDQLGEHVTQKGSLVDNQRLRFDFSHPKAVSREELKSIEDKVNAVISQGGAVSTQEMAPDDAIKAGAMALFGEKYGDKVRVLSMGKGTAKAYSVELCGGTHVRKLEDIELFKITSEGSVASGIRRIEAVTRSGVRNYLQTELDAKRQEIERLEGEQVKLLQALNRLPNPSKNDPCDLFEAPPHKLLETYELESNRQNAVIERLQNDNKKLGKELAEMKKQQALGGGEVKAEKIGNVNFIGKIFDGLDPKEMRPVAEEYLKQADVVVIGTAVEGKASILVGVNKALAGKLSAVPLVQAAVAELGGKGGGGRPEMAQGGGPEAGKLSVALERIKSRIASS